MKLVRRLALGGIFLLYILGDVVDAQSGHGGGDWITHHNKRFGLTLQYPADLFELERTAKAGDGEMFSAPDLRARLVVGAVANTKGYDPASYQAFTERKSYSKYRVTYRQRGRTWFVLSGVGDGKIFYEKVIFSCGGRLINGFALTYPVQHRATVDPVVERIEDSFRPGNGHCP